MIPNIFISSTIEDLQYLRDAIRELIIDLSYHPVMSEYGDVGYIPDRSVEESCYATIAECQLAILFIGKRYGSVSGNQLSITHNEYRVAKDKKIPIITLVDSEVQSFKRVYDANIENVEKPNYPGMDHPKGTFQLIKEVSESPLNNGILPFNSVNEAKNKLKKQLALVFGNLLRTKFDPVNSQLNDVLAEIKTLRHNLIKENINDTKKYMSAIRLLLDFEFKLLKDLSEVLFRDIEDAPKILIKSKTFEDFLNNSGVNLVIKEEFNIIIGRRLMENGKLKTWHQFDASQYIESMSREWSYYSIDDKNNIRMDEEAKKCFENIYEDYQNQLKNRIFIL